MIHPKFDWTDMNPIIVRFVKAKIWSITCDELSIEVKLKADSYDEAVEKFNKFIEAINSRGINQEEIPSFTDEFCA